MIIRSFPTGFLPHLDDTRQRASAQIVWIARFRFEADDLADLALWEAETQCGTTVDGAAGTKACHLWPQ